jgi:glycerol-1-phosphate dehydrogenase [NAD(P)+]
MKVDVNDFCKPCDCGREHKIFVKDIIIEEGAIYQMKELLFNYYDGEYKDIAIICDTNTYLVAGKLIEELLIGCNAIILQSGNLHANNHGVSLAKDQLDRNTKLILAVGSGTIHDISRYLAHELNIPFVSVPTAASVDGFVSTVAAMTWDGFKTTLPAASPMLVVADSAVFSKAPYRLTASGISDLLGKYTAIIDWRISHLVTGEYICERVCDLETNAVNKVIHCIKDLRNYENKENCMKAYEELMYALILSGMAMQMVGNSRPASGAEHHISHLLEMEVINEAIDAYHGEKVSVGLLLAIHTYEEYKQSIKNNRYLINKNTDLELQLLKSTFGEKGLYEGMLKENTPNPLATIDLDRLEEVMPQIATILESLPSYDKIYHILEEASCIKDIEELGLEKNLVPLLLKLSPYVRNRLTFMRLIKLIQI